jgi:hypothetical protein
MSTEFKFSEAVGPICVPDTPKFMDRPASEKDKDMRAFVAGWGATFSTCDTNRNGPMPHTQCKFPFKFQGKTYDRLVSIRPYQCQNFFHLIVPNRCSKKPPPSAHNKICQQFFRWAKKEDPEFNMHNFNKVYSVYFWDPSIRKPRYTTCYSTMVTPKQSPLIYVAQNVIMVESEFDLRMVRHLLPGRSELGRRGLLRQIPDWRREGQQ